MSRLAQAAPARKEALPAKVALAGPAGSGKTYSALQAAEVFAAGGRILVIDTERRSANLYADVAKFDAIDWVPPYDPRELARTIGEAASSYAVIVIDSLSHFWFAEGGTLDIVDDAGKRARGNSYAGWKEGTPAQEGMYEAILAAPCHVICCIRSKTEYVLEMDSRGKQVPRKVGMAPVQREGVEYQFTVQLDLDFEHNALVGKTRCPLLSEKVYGPGTTTEWASTLLAWLNSGDAPLTPCPRCEFVAERMVVRQHLIDNHGYLPDSTGKVHPPKTTDASSIGTQAAPAAPNDEGHDPSAGVGPSPVPPGDTGGGETAERAHPAAVPPPVVPGTGPTTKQLGLIHGTLKKLGVVEDDRHRYCSDLLSLPAPVASLNDLTGKQVRELIDALLAEETGVPA